jgi:hypothetical protein
MKTRFSRIALVVLALAGQAAAGFFVYRTEQQREGARGALAALTRDVSRAQAVVGELRGAQTGMVATGQDSSFWVPKIAALTKDALAALEPLDRGQLATEAAQDLAAATSALADFTRASDQVRDLLATDQPLTASSIAFGDGARHLSTAAGALAAAVPSQTAALDREAARTRPLEGFALAGAALLTLAVLLLLLPRATEAPSAAAETEAPAAGVALSLAAPLPAEPAPFGRTNFDFDIRKPPPPAPVEIPAAVAHEMPHESEEAIVQELQRESQLRLNTEAQVDLAGAARLCSDLACVRESSQLPALLERAAELLDASGIVLWMTGAGSTMLRPAASYGYSELTLARMKALAGRSDNAVSVAFRKGRMEVVAGSTDRNGALVAPVVTVGGIAGALSVEIRHGAESSPSIQAVVAIIAAQLASLVADATTT